MTLEEFLLARIAEDEEAVNSAGHDFVEIEQYMLRAARPNSPIVFTEGRMLAECEAKRRLIEHANEASGYESQLIQEFGDPGQPSTEPDLGERILLTLALPYADHPDYDAAVRS